MSDFLLSHKFNGFDAKWLKDPFNTYFQIFINLS